MLKKPDTTVNTQLCLKLADFVEGLETKHPTGEFATSDWVAVTVGDDGSIEIHNKAHLDDGPKFFSMRVLYRHEECGTIACLCGSLAHMLGKDKIFTSFQVASEALGITHDQAKALFTPPGWSHSKATAHDAAKVVRHLALTGEVDWGIIREEEGHGREQDFNSV